LASTIRDVARLANASVAAVSATISGTRSTKIRVGAETRERILAAAAQLAYVPNRVAQSLALRKTGVLGLVFPYSHAFVDHNPFCTQIMSGVMEAAVQARYNLMLHTAVGDNWNATDEAALIDPRVDGLLLVLPNPCSQVVARCRREGFPCVSIAYTSYEDEDYAVNADEYRGGRMAAEHLLELGHRRIAHIEGFGEVATSAPRREGYLAALAAAGQQPDPALIVPGSFNVEGGYAAMNQLLKMSATRRPSAVFACNDLCAAGVLRALGERGLRAPNDVALVGYDDTWFATMTSPPLTSVHMPILEMGTLAAQMLIDLVEGRTPKQRHPVLPVSFSVRTSCGAQPVR
jgi:LacI family transcriptional regulator